MDNEKRVILAIILSMAVFYVYYAFLAPPPAPPREPAEVSQEAAPQQVPEIKKNKAATIKPPDRKQKISTASEALTSVPEFPVTVDTSLFTAIFLQGTSGLASFRLHNYKDRLPPPAVVKLFKSKFGNADPLEDESTADYSGDKEMIHLAAPATLPLRTSFIESDGALPEGLTWTSDKENVRFEGSGSTASLTFSARDSQGLTLHKEFIFSQEDYSILFNYTLRNDASSERQGNPFVEWTTPRPKEGGGGFFAGRNRDVSRFSYFIKDKVEKKDLHKIEEEITIQGDDVLWTAIEEKYFTSALIPKDQKPLQIRIDNNESTLAYQLIFPFVTLAPGQEKTYSFSIYIGPKDIDILKTPGAHLEKTLDFGMFDIIAKPLLLSLKFFYRYLGNYGLSIILITIIIKILFWPLTQKSFKSMQGMQQLKPEIDLLKEKHKDNKEEFAKQQMSLYKKYNVNPLGGCLPILLQIPVFIALYRALMYSIELRHAEFISFWINDLSAKDPTYIAPLVMGVSMFLQQKMTPSAADPAQQKMFMFMPIMFTFMMINFPSGLVIYWLVNNVLSIAQQLYINKKTKVAGGSKECSPSKSKPKQSKKRSQ